MKKFLLPLTGIMLCAATLQSAAADPAVPLQTKQGEESHAVVTDMPDIDMSHADPRTWHSLPPAAQVKNDFSEEELDQPTGFNFESSQAAMAVIGSMPLVK
jgi:hypothetical protein